MKDSRTLFGVLPYLTLFEPVTILGVDLDVAETDAARHLFDEILSFFRDAPVIPLARPHASALGSGLTSGRPADAGLRRASGVPGSRSGTPG